jgi:transcriptional antiterminator RfaH
MNSSGPVLMCGSVWKETSWFAVHAKPRREKFAVRNVEASGVETLLPLVKIERLLRGATQRTAKPLFPGYFFARFCPERALNSVKYALGVLQVVSAGQIPIPVPGNVVGDIQDRVQGDGFIRIYPQGLAPGTRVTIQTGPFEGMVGRVERELDDQKRVAIFLDTLLQARVLIERRWIEAEAA